MDTLQRIQDLEKTATVRTFPQMYPLSGEKVKTLDDLELSAIMFATKQGTFKPSAVDDSKQGREALIAGLPDELKEHYGVIRDKSWSFYSGHDVKFDRVVLLARNGQDGKSYDGILIGFGDNDLYYVLATWDTGGVNIGAIVPKK